MENISCTVRFRIGRHNFEYTSRHMTLVHLESGEKERLYEVSGAKAVLARLISSPKQPVSNDELIKVSRGSAASLDVNICNARSIIRNLANDPSIGSNFIRSGGQARTFDPDFVNVEDHLVDLNLWKPEYADLNENEAEGYKRIGSLIEHLVYLYPNELKDFFAVSAGGIRMPFFVLDPAKFGRVEFPMPISDEILPSPDRGKYSLVTRRKASGSQVYPGQEYRLIRASKDRPWQLGRTIYTELVDDCDYFKAQILIGWGRLRDASKKDRENFLKTDADVLEWLRRVKQIKEGDFSGYHAGMAFSIPIFQRLPDRRLRMLLARGSNSKQADAKKLHCCPAGMLEFSASRMNRDRELTPLNFGTYALKEMIEETLRAKAFTFSAKIDRLDSVQEEGDHLPAKILRNYCEDIILDIKEEIRIGNLFVEMTDGSKKPVSLAAINEALKLHETLHERQIYAVVDAFVLRPEFIVPVYVDEDVPLLLSWENDEPDTVDFDGPDDVEKGLPSHAHNWTAPGLAAAYLTARDWFSRT